MTIARFRETRKSVKQILSNREMDVLLGLAKGENRRSISERLGISVLTYDEHRKNIKKKLRLNTQADWASVIVLFRNVSADKE